MRKSRHSIQRLLAGSTLLASLAATALAPPSLQVLLKGTPHDALFAVSFDREQGLAVGAGGAIFDSRDGGRTWSAVTPAPTELGLMGVSAAAGRALAVGQYGLVLRREGSGAWQQAESGSKQRLFAVSLNAQGQAVAVGAFGTVLFSSDAGKSWQAVAPDWTPYTSDGQQPHLYASSIDEAGNLLVAGEFGLILRRSVQSGDWQLLHKGDASLFALRLDKNGHTWAVGQSGCVLRSEDQGQSWQTVDIGSQANLLGIQDGGPGEVLITGMREALRSTDGGSSWQALRDPLVPASWFAGIAQAGDGALITVGNNGQIVRIKN
ncbi:Uncharacterized protein SAMN04488038_104275 [Solimonas aquatica]|uniref:Photosynthesis system II assembly factor Ycf48/Hcf136-like domain-containing protein n=1 Tax=Solimonas aquatica TaxID=489703 RepID=A0A1H9E4A0_9GAMM|nr:YCF48-related protein [Solimonas aquatica]SEQ20432.1 Uncharacterized protein SAMN04488038_104275 [Solimonas aquatica]